MKRFIAGIFGAVLVLNGMAIPAMGGAGPTYNVQMGALLDETIFADGNNFYPDQISIHPADQLRFTTGGFHTATLLPVNEDPDTWLAANAAPGGEYSLLQPDPDDGPNGFKYNVQKILLPSDPDCGTTTACNYDGTAVVNSGVAIDGPLEFTTRLDVPAGSTVWAVCTIHPGTMRMQIDVVAEATPVQTQADIDTARAAAIADDTAAAQALHDGLIDDHSSHLEGDRKVWDMYAGYDTEQASRSSASSRPSRESGRAKESSGTSAICSPKTTRSASIGNKRERGSWPTTSSCSATRMATLDRAQTGPSNSKARRSATTRPSWRRTRRSR